MNAPVTPICVPDALAALDWLVLRSVIGASLRAGDQPPIRGLAPETVASLCARCLPGVPVAVAPGPARLDEFEELFELLLEHASPRDEMARWLAAAIATAAQREDHLWQDMGLPSRRELSAILTQRFASLAALNVHDMKWKKFFYRQLCQRAGVPICKSPNCLICVDRPLCFGPEV